MNKINWREPHEYHETPCDGEDILCACGLPEDNPLHIKSLTKEYEDGATTYTDIDKHDWKSEFEIEEHGRKTYPFIVSMEFSHLEEIVDQATSKAREEENKFYPIAKAIPCPVCGFQVVFENKSLKKDK